MSRNLVRLVRRFRQLHAVVIGDAMLDRYSNGNCRRLCPEAPVPVVDIDDTCEQAGGAGNSAVNLRGLGAQVAMISVVGADAEGFVLRRILQQQGVSTVHVSADRERGTLTKHRIVAGSQILLRIDEGSTTGVASAAEQRVLEAIDTLVPAADLVLVADYGYGILTPRVVERLAQWQVRQPRTLVLDSKDLLRYSSLGATAVKPNFREVQQLLGVKLHGTNGDRWQEVLPYGDEILNRCGSQIAAVTLDEDGAVVFQHGQPPYRTSAHPRPHSHAVGAGDTFLAAMALALSAGASASMAADIASAAAKVVVSKQNTAACTAAELLEALGAGALSSGAGELVAQVEAYRRAGRKIVFTNGCFDVLHSGHVEYLRRARSLGDVLIAGVNSDESIRRLKGAGRPINSLEDRLAVLSSLSCVDHVVPFYERTPHRLIRMIRPDVFVKGGDYTRQSLPEAALVEELGGKVVILGYLNGRSTTALIERIREAESIPLNLTDTSQRDGYAPGKLG